MLAPLKANRIALMAYDGSRIGNRSEVIGERLGLSRNLKRLSVAAR